MAIGKTNALNVSPFYAIYAKGVTSNTSTSFTATQLSITIPASGRYLFQWASSASIYDGTTALYKNGVVVNFTTLPVPVTDPLVVNGAYVNNLAIGDVITVYSKTNTAGGTVNTSMIVGELSE